jgi:hypothetical protein
VLIPQSFSFTAYIGATFDGQINFWQDSAQTIPFDFSPWTITFTITAPGGIVTPSFQVVGGSILFALTAAQTAAAAAQTETALMTLTDGATPPSVEYIAKGTFSFVNP